MFQNVDNFLLLVSKVLPGCPTNRVFQGNFSNSNPCNEQQLKTCPQKHVSIIQANIPNNRSIERSPDNVKSKFQKKTTSSHPSGAFAPRLGTQRRERGILQSHLLSKFHTSIDAASVWRAIHQFICISTMRARNFR